jgi:hypothetical protein
MPEYTRNVKGFSSAFWGCIQIIGVRASLQVKVDKTVDNVNFAQTRFKMAGTSVPLSERMSQLHSSYCRSWGRFCERMQLDEGVVEAAGRTGVAELVDEVEQMIVGHCIIIGMIMHLSVSFENAK